MGDGRKSKVHRQKSGRSALGPLHYLNQHLVMSLYVGVDAIHATTADQHTIWSRQSSRCIKVVQTVCIGAILNPPN
jgi:hypothetical protein